MTIKSLTRIVFLSTSTLALAACMGNYDAAKTRAIPTVGGAFNEALKQKYADFVVAEQQEGDYNDSLPYLAKAEAAAKGQEVQIDQAFNEYAAGWRAKVIAVVDGFKTKDPVRAATAQVAFDCYNHELMEGSGIHPDGTDPHGCKAIMINALVTPLAAAPAAAPVTVALPAPFIVYFGFNKSDLDADAKATVADAAKAIKNYKVTKVIVEGNTDTMGTTAFNQTLSEMRATTVDQALVGLGIPSNQQTMKAFGETHLKVATPDQTKEAKNRRVEIRLEQ